MVKLRVAELLKQKHKSKYWFTNQMGSEHQYISKLLKNETKSISFDTIDKICHILDVEPKDLIYYRKEDKKNEQNLKWI